jgi:hypothetical protein
MILKGNQRGGGQQLAAHLLNSFDNERVEIADVRGAVARDLSGAFAEWAAEARGTKCQKFLYSLSLNPDQSQGHLTRAQYLELLERTERSLKLVGQPRAVVFHEKRDKDGIVREHCHAVWSRIDTDKMKAVQISHDRLKLRTVAQDFARKHGLELPDGMKPGGSRNSRTDHFNNRASEENLAEKQQQERSGVPKEVRMAELASCWHGTKTGSEFVHAMEDKGYYLARGDSGRYVVVDLYGAVHSLYRQIEDVKSSQVKERLAGYPLDKLPDVESAKAYAKQKRQEREKALEKGGTEPERAEEPAALAKKKAALQERQAERRAQLDRQGLDLYARQFRERGALRELQASNNADVTATRLEKQPKGLAALLTRITGVGKFVSWAQGKADSKRAASHKNETRALVHRHDRELKELDRHYRALGRLEARENRAAETAKLREGYRKLRERSFALRPEFEKALAARKSPASGSSGDRAYARLFNRVAGSVGLTKGDLQAAFERAQSRRGRPPEDKETEGRAPVDPERLERARHLHEDFERSRRARGERDRDRER